MSGQSSVATCAPYDVSDVLRALLALVHVHYMYWARYDTLICLNCPYSISEFYFFVFAHCSSSNRGAVQILSCFSCSGGRSQLTRITLRLIEFYIILSSCFYYTRYATALLYMYPCLALLSQATMTSPTDCALGEDRSTQTVHLRCCSTLLFNSQDSSSHIVICLLFQNYYDVIRTSNTVHVHVCLFCLYFFNLRHLRHFCAYLTSIYVLTSTQLFECTI